jgi:hypothetical protein
VVEEPRYVWRTSRKVRFRRPTERLLVWR